MDSRRDTLAEVSSADYEPCMDIPNLAVCKAGPGGKVLLYSSHGELDIVADVVACHSLSGNQHKPVTPANPIAVVLHVTAVRAQLHLGVPDWCGPA